MIEMFMPHTSCQFYVVPSKICDSSAVKNDAAVTDLRQPQTARRVRTIRKYPPEKNNAVQEIPAGRGRACPLRRGRDLRPRSASRLLGGPRGVGDLDQLEFIIDRPIGGAHQGNSSTMTPPTESTAATNPQPPYSQSTMYSTVF